jgi:hypothetical protein
MLSSEIGLPAGWPSVGWLGNARFGIGIDAVNPCAKVSALKSIFSASYPSLNVFRRIACLMLAELTDAQLFGNEIDANS